MIHDTPSSSRSSELWIEIDGAASISISISVSVKPTIEDKFLSLSLSLRCGLNSARSMNSDLLYHINDIKQIVDVAIQLQTTIDPVIPAATSGSTYYSALIAAASERSSLDAYHSTIVLWTSCTSPKSINSFNRVGRKWLLRLKLWIGIATEIVEVEDPESPGKCKRIKSVHPWHIFSTWRRCIASAHHHIQDQRLLLLPCRYHHYS